MGMEIIMLYSRTVKGFGGTWVHQDSNGRIIGSSKPNPFNSKEYFHYNTESVLCGRSSPNLGGGYMHYNAGRCFVGRSDKNPFWGYVHYDSDGLLAGKSEPSFGGDYANYDVKINIL